MGQDKKEKVLELFFEYPNQRFTVRKISELTKIPRATIHKIFLDLKKEGLVTKNNESGSSLIFKTKKVNYFVERIVRSGLIEELVKKLNPSCIILFGSIRKGDSVKGSDIDLFVESSVKKKVDLSRFEKRLKHPVQLFVESDINELHKNLFNNIVNGIKIFGVLKLK